MPLEQPILIRQYTSSVRWLALRSKGYGISPAMFSHGALRGPESIRSACAPPITVGGCFTVGAAEGTV